MDYSIISIRLGTDGTGQLFSLCLSTVVHHQYLAIQDAKPSTQVVLVTRDGVGSCSFFEDAQ